MTDMFCFQCEQTAKGTGCTIGGVCGKKADTANIQDKLTGSLLTLANIVKSPTKNTYRIIIEGLFTTITNVAFDNQALDRQIKLTADEILTHGEGSPILYDMKNLWTDNEDIRSLKSLFLLGLKGMAAYAYHALVLNYSNDTINDFFIEGLKAIAKTDISADDLLALITKFGFVNLACMELLDKANTQTYGHPVPTKVSTIIEKGPFIVVSGHDLLDLELLLKQSQGKGINIYTHGEMLPAHAYPNLKKYSHLKGNFGTAWQNQQKEFIDIQGAVLFTTNCIMPVKDNYKDRIFTTEVVSFPGLTHINHNKDFSPIIEKALSLGGYSEDKHFTGINGGNVLTTGFGHNAVLSQADKIVDAVKAGAIKKFLLVGGCDGAKPGRNYYTNIVKQSPKDSIILTLACGKYRFNDLDLGDIGGFPRIMDMGQCNDSFSAIQVAIALSKAFNCDINDLPLTLVLSWYEQKAVCVLLTLLSLGLKNIYLGPTLPAFISPNVLNILVEKFNITPISTPEEDLKKIFS